MFSYLRPHRRTPSTPTSAIPDHVYPTEAQLHHTTAQAYQGWSRTQDVHIPQQRLQGVNASPPVLPPIHRVASYGSDQLAEPQYIQPQSEEVQAQGTSSYTPETPPWIQDRRPGSAGNAGNAGSTRPSVSQPPRPQTGIASNHSSKDRSSREPFKFVTITDIESPNIPQTRRPPPPPPTQPNTSIFGPVQPRSGKTRLNLLNPMSLLARRRNSQGPTFPTPPPLVPKRTEVKSTDGYDPRIRGTKVHDFSAPRPKRNVSYGDVQGLQDQSTSGDSPSDSSLRVPAQKDNNRWSGGKHSPAFTEDFEEEQYPAAGPHVRKATDFTDLHVPQPAFAKGASRPQGEPSMTIPNPPALEDPPQLDDVTETLGLAQSLPAAVTIHHQSSVSSKSRSRNASQSSKRDSKGPLPKHMKSTSSRFSFDMIGAASQEKLLEDRHRKRALEKNGSGTEPRDEYENEGEDDFDYDNMGDDDGLEERIPGVNADAEEDEDDGALDATPEVNPGIAGFTFHSMNISAASSPLSTYSPVMVNTPRDADGEVIGFAITKGTPTEPKDQTSEYSVSPLSPIDDSPVRPLQYTSGSTHYDLGFRDDDDLQKDGQAPISNNPPEVVPAFASPPKTTPDEDDLYFDDGIIEHPSDVEDAPEFDESVFDNDDTDDYGRPLRPISSLPTIYSPPFVKLDGPSSGLGRAEGLPGSRISQDLQEPEPQSATSVYSNDYAVKSPMEEHERASYDDALKPAHSLTQDTLSAYQSALAEAAYNAAANGRFRRDSNSALYLDERDEDPGITNENGELFSREPLPPSYDDDFVFGDTLSDDAIIAEANAEALANDHDNFYGQEFNFYSAPASGELQYGGFFGPGGPAASTNQNGRVAGREPNLTPITERSEYSNRNSIMSLPLGAVSLVSGQGNLNSPGLAQLAGMMFEQDEEDLSPDALLKLRRGAWGGSQASLRSSNGGGLGLGNSSPMSAGGRGDGSPVLQLASSVAGQGAGSVGFGHGRGGSGSTVSTGLVLGGGADGVPTAPVTDGTESGPPSPTLTKGMNWPTKHRQSQQLIGSLSNFPPTILESSTPAPSAALVSSLNSRPLSPTPKRSSAVGMVSPSDFPSSPEPEYSTFGSISSTESSTVTGGKKDGKTRHRHSASSDSISYMKEDDPVVGKRWVLERRRTGESGEVEILGREIIQGGRI